MEEEPQPTSSNITKTGSTMHRKLEEIEDNIIQFTNLPMDAPSLGNLAQHIQEKLRFMKNLLHAEISSKGTKPHDLFEIEERLTELEATFYHANLHSVKVDHMSDDGESGWPGSGSVCESCLNEDRVDVSSVFEGLEMLHEVVVPPEACCESTVPVLGHEKVETFEFKRWWWRMVAVLTTVSAALMVSFSDYVVGNEHGDFLTPT